MGFFSRLFSHKNKEREFVRRENEYEGALEYLGSRIHNKEARTKYIEGCINQMKLSSDEIDSLNREYDSITARLNDMDEIDRLPAEMREPLLEICKMIVKLEAESKEYFQYERKMTESDYNKMEKLEPDMPKAYEDLIEAEEFQKKIKSDLYHLEGEKQAFFYRRAEIEDMTANVRVVFYITIVALVLCVILLLVLYFAFDWSVKLGVMIATVAAMISFTALFARGTDMQREAVRIEKSIVKLINLHNSVKIRYVNNTNLLDYLYVKYKVDSARELKGLWDLYVVEKAEREKMERAREELPLYKKDLVNLLGKMHISDPVIWIHQLEAIMDKSEMVELRHSYIMARQAIRGRIDENKRYGELAHDELTQIMNKYPVYATEIMKMLDEVQ